MTKSKGKRKRSKSKKKNNAHQTQSGHLALLPKNRDMALIILKGHLLLEEEINNRLEELLPHPEALAGTKLDFQQRACFLNSVAPENISRNTEWKLIEKTNIIRNILAYNPTDEEIEKIVESFLAEFEENTEKPPYAKNAKTENKLRKALSNLCDFISSF